MNTLSKELTILPGVIGACISLKNKGILFSSLPEVFTKSMVEETASGIRRMTQMAESKKLQPQTLSIHYNTFDIIAIPLSDNALVLIFCEPESNTALVAATACMFVPELEKMIFHPPESVPATLQTLLKDDQNHLYKETAHALDLIQQALAETVGTISDMVYDESFEHWTTKNTADIARIFELIGYISIEIDNPELFAEFKEKIQVLL